MFLLICCLCFGRVLVWDLGTCFLWVGWCCLQLLLQFVDCLLCLVVIVVLCGSSGCRWLLVGLWHLLLLVIACCLISLFVLLWHLLFYLFELIAWFVCNGFYWFWDLLMLGVFLMDVSWWLIVWCSCFDCVCVGFCVVALWCTNIYLWFLLTGLPCCLLFFVLFWICWFVALIPFGCVGDCCLEFAWLILLVWF